MRKNAILIAILVLLSLSITFVQASYRTEEKENISQQSQNVAIKKEETPKEEESLKEQKESQVEKATDTVDELSHQKDSTKKDTSTAVAKSATNTQSSQMDKSNNTGSVAATKQISTPPPQETPSAPPTQPQTPTPQAAPVVQGEPSIDVSNAKNGSIRAKYLSTNRLKVRIVKGDGNYNYDLPGDNTYQSFPLQMGDGLYKISIMENVGGSSYKYVLTQQVEVVTPNPNARYLTSVSMINWNTSMAAIKKAQALASGKSDSQKVSSIYSFIVGSVQYNSSITELPSGYLPNISTTYSSKSGICYDFASLFAAMLRSVDVPTKLVKGTATNVSGYHAWNEVYVDGRWKTIDTSYDSQARAAGLSYSMYKSGGYSKQSEY